MSTYTALAAFDDEPTPGDLAAIAAQEPVITAEVAVVDAECRMAMSPDELAVKAHRRAVVALGVAMRTAVETSTNRATSTAPAFTAGSPLSTARRVVIRPAVRTA
ncbi:hypothetical protein APR04_005780 [Promicromonospora umidemergens]|uniref:Uncharacterized protein n=1 Tax=Promicromonospora umidemergens TaxID=629679 RepID=A0ABP8WNH7_9MICO|nr:DUF6284 family protein [Promicromonospora umidemergens]MCP2286840.1 hypothetical protein [Promicromonospora umidemergens]